VSDKVVCLRPEADFARVGAPAPSSLSVSYMAPDSADLHALLHAADALVIPAVGPKLPGALFDGLSLKLIQVTGAGVDRLDRAEVEKAGIPVANVAGGSNAAVAEYVTASASTLLRRLAWSSSEIRKGNYNAFRARLLTDNVGGIEGLTIGIVGFGVIGMAVAEAFHQQGCTILFYDPAPADPERAAGLGARRVELAELLTTADVVTLHVPLLPATTGLIGTKELAAMKPGAVLIQASRGGIVEEQALADALASGHLGGAAVDVFSTEPPTADNPILKLAGEGADRLILTPHIAGVTRQAAAFLFRSAWHNVERVLINGKAPHSRVY
jgi:phosphoglycerate dehydrogenase-like enzyme